MIMLDTVREAIKDRFTDPAWIADSRLDEAALTEGLQVRVCGWNVLWNNMAKVEQDAYILRAESIAQ